MRKTLTRTLYEFRYPGLFQDVRNHLPLFSLDDPKRISAIQVRNFNAVWARCWQSFDIYRGLKRRFGLPDRIDKIEDVRRFPILSKSDLQDASERIVSESAASNTISTGGSTGTPLVIPVDKRNAYRALRNAAVGRAFHSIELGDPIFLIWGHHHLFGTGWSGRIRYAKRKAADWLNNMQRASAYDLNEQSLRKIVSQVAASGARAVIGYSAAIRQVARAFLPRDGRSQSTMKRLTWILTSETISDDDPALIKQAFDGKTVCEYGLSEFGPVAYSRNSMHEIVPFWWSFYVYLDDNNRVIVTDLEQAAFPFINYATGDLAHPHIEPGLLSKISGRENDLVRLWMRSGKERIVHSEFFTHVSAMPEVLAYQVIQRSESVNIRLKVRDGTEARVAGTIRSNLLLEDDELDVSRVHITFDYERITSISGKEKFVSRQVVP